MGLIWLLVVSESQQWKQTCSCCVGPACSFGSWWLVLICSMRKVLLAGVWFLGAHQQLDSSGSGGSVTSALHCTALHCTARSVFLSVGSVGKSSRTHRSEPDYVRYGTERSDGSVHAALLLHPPCTPHPCVCVCVRTRSRRVVRRLAARGDIQYIRGLRPPRQINRPPHNFFPNNQRIIQTNSEVSPNLKCIINWLNIINKYTKF
jgi:hypothetical protein